jgi:rare lipoprotein A
MDLARKTAVILIASTLGGTAVGAIVILCRGARSGEPIPAKTTTPTPAAATFETGVAAYYARKFHGAMTASGERLDVNALTAAHRTLPFGTYVKVTNLANGKSVTVRINDRGPHDRGRVIDLSPGAAEALDMVRAGVANVELRPIDDSPVTRVE